MQDLIQIFVWIILLLTVLFWWAFVLWKYRQFIIQEVKDNLKMQLEVKFSLERHTILTQVREWRNAHKKEKKARIKAEKLNEKMKNTWRKNRYKRK